MLVFIVTAVILGGVDIFGGRGRVAGVALALLLLGTPRNSMGLASVAGPVPFGDTVARARRGPPQRSRGGAGRRSRALSPCPIPSASQATSPQAAFAPASRPRHAEPPGPGVERLHDAGVQHDTLL
jgi:hypothetical protein